MWRNALLSRKQPNRMATLFYGKGGWAFSRGEVIQATTKPRYQPTSTGTFSGWVAGGGIEHLISDRLSVKIECLHFDFGSRAACRRRSSRQLLASTTARRLGTSSTT